jgi:hypothetical protein
MDIENFKKVFLAMQTKEDDSSEEYMLDKRKKKRRIVRNEFKLEDKYGLPIIKKQDIDLNKIDLWCWNKAKLQDDENSNKTIHFFTYDWKFESVYNKPEQALDKLKQYYAILTPDFSAYTDMPLVLQMYSTFKNRWCGAYLQSQGLKVIATINWGTPKSYDCCFAGVEKRAVVAVCTYRRENNKEGFMHGYDVMFETIQPSAVVCYGTPFPEMRGNIKAIDPFDRPFLIKQLGRATFEEKLANGELYPSR